MSAASVKFCLLTAAQYANLESKDAGTLYFLSDKNRVYRGTVPYSHPIELVTEFPATGLVGTLYVNTATREGKAWNGSAWVTVQLAVSTTVENNDTTTPTGKAVQNYVANALNGYVNGASYDGTTGKLTLTKGSGGTVELNLPVENFLSAASYDASTHKLTLTMTDETTFDVDLADLIDEYTGGSSDTASVSVSGGTVTASVKVSATDGNQVEAKSDGLFVPALLWQTVSE